MIKSLHIKNFRSFPNCETTISFTEGINLIEGTNGSGKSTITNALLWGIWGMVDTSTSISKEAYLNLKEPAPQVAPAP